MSVFKWTVAAALVSALGLIAYEISTADTVSVSLHREITTTLKPGVWHGFVLGPSVPKRAYLAVVSPGSEHVATDKTIALKTVAVQTEFSEKRNQWSDVLRIQAPDTSNEDQQVKVHVFKVANENFFSGSHSWISPTGLIGRFLNSVGYAQRPRVWVSTTGNVQVAD